jgi:hypothetical protein
MMSCEEQARSHHRIGLDRKERALWKVDLEIALEVDLGHHASWRSS